MPIIKNRELKLDELKDLFKEVHRKAVAGELGSSSEERLANTHLILSKGAYSIEHALNKFVTVNEAMLKIKARIRLLYGRAEPVLITGPTGVGKELLAKAFQIADSPFIAENCAGIPENLVESIFFGHRKGAFTGAFDDHVGLLEEAGEGVIFLDEIGDMPLPIQAKFLRAIQENEIRRVGSTEIIDLSCRFVAATKYDLEERVAKKLFREDLYARLFTYQIKVTPLIERPEDVQAITEALLPNGKVDLERLASQGLWPFPGFILEKIHKYNVRAIEAALARERAYHSYEE